jgi:predicted ATP-grasp superfamily ATP-dependent carboligase
MTWRVMQRAIAAGCDSFDMMGRGEFKRKFGAVPDDTKRRWIRSDHALLTAARPLAKAVHRMQQVVRGRLHRGVGRGAARRQRRDAHTQPPVVLGDIDLVRALGLDGLRVDVVAPPGDAARYSRHTRHALPWHDPWRAPEALLTALLRHAHQQPEPPPLLYQDDASLLFVSRHRDRLAPLYRFVVPPADLVERLVDKRRFRDLASTLGLPVPAAEVFDPSRASNPHTLSTLTPPFVLKPLVRRPREWDPVAHGQKALLVESAEDLARLWPRLRGLGGPVLAQALVPGPESAIESYHIYMDASGHRRAEFTGRKLRTHPLVHGDSSAIVITDAEDVRSLGRAIADRLGLRGVAKFDFKRRPDGTLALLEVNPRFTLWHHPAAVAGVNIPALVVRDLLGRTAPRLPGSARAGVHWCKPWTDIAAARASGVSLWHWLLWCTRCESMRAFAWRDPLPVIGAAVHRFVRRAHRPSPAHVPAPREGVA